MRILACLCTLFFMMLAGCGDQSAEEKNAQKEEAAAETTTPTETPEKVADNTPATVEFLLINSGATSAIKADMTTIYKLDTTESWQKFWADHTKNLQPAEPAPVIDFNNSMLIAIVDTDQPSSGYEMNVDKLETVNDKIYVYATRKQPGAGCVNLGMISQPFTIIQVPKSNLVPELRLTTQTVTCE